MEFHTPGDKVVKISGIFLPVLPAFREKARAGGTFAPCPRGVCVIAASRRMRRLLLSPPHPFPESDPEGEEEQESIGAEVSAVPSPRGGDRAPEPPVVVPCVFRRNPATIPRPNRPLFRRESGHRSEGNSAGVPSRFRPLFLGGSELIRTVPD